MMSISGLVEIILCFRLLVLLCCDEIVRLMWNFCSVCRIFLELLIWYVSVIDGCVFEKWLIVFMM